MNAIFYKITQPAEKDIIDSICRLVAQRDFKEAEAIVVAHLDSLMAREYNTEDDVEKALSDLRVLYVRFNEYYLNWAEAQGKSRHEELKALQNSSHDNFLFAHMTDPESMDDLMYAVAEYLTHNEEDAPLEEATKHLDYYTKSIAS